MGSSTAALITGSMVARRAAGGGNLSVKLKHHFSSKLQTEVHSWT
jgi:hypothetical protein